jgi:hypothetical protein
MKYIFKIPKPAAHMKLLLRATMLGYSLFMFIGTFAQNPSPAPTENKWCFESEKPLSPFAYRRMMRDHYNFTIMGSNTPVSGFKIETNKPTITLKGNITSPRTEKDLLVNLELTGGLQNDFMQLLSGDDVNGYFKASVGFNKMITQGNSASYVMDDDLLKAMLRKKACMYREEVASQIDTFLVLQALQTYIKPNTTIPVLSDLATGLAIVDAKKDEYTIARYKRPFDDNLASIYYRNIILEVIKNYGADAKEADEDKRFQKFVKDFNENRIPAAKIAKLADDYKRLSKFKADSKHKYRLIDAYEIETYKEVWTSKRITWINVSFAAINSSFKLYDQAVAPEKLIDSNSFLPSVNVSYNYLWKAASANQYFYIRAGVGVRRINSLVDQQSFEYNKETVISVTPTETLKSKKSGTAYMGGLTHGLGFEIPLEVYWAPWTQAAVPGLYSKWQYNYGKAWLNKNKISVDLGMVWNVLNNEKDSKSVLTIVPYANWSNILREYKDATKTEKKKLGELFSVGVKFGIPVNLGK